MIDEIKVHVVVSLCEELCDLDPCDPRYAIVNDKLDDRWQALSSAEQDSADQILVQRASRRGPLSARRDLRETRGKRGHDGER